MQIKKMNLNDMVRKTVEDSYPKEFLKLINLKELTVGDRDSEFATIKEIGTTLPNLKVIKK